MRILQCNDSFLPIMDGVGNVMYHYAKLFGQMGHESYVLCSQMNTGYRGNFPFEIVDYVGVPFGSSYRVGTPQLDLHCQQRLNMLNLDIVHAHSPFGPGQTGLLIARKRRIPIIGSFHSKYYDDFLQATGGVETLADVGVRYVVDFYSKCDEVWTVSQSSAETLRSYGYHGEISIMPNGTDIVPVSGQDIADVSARLGLGIEPVLLYAGQLNWKKNIRCILDAASMLDIPFKLVLAGQGPHASKIKEYASSLNLDDRVLFPGHFVDRTALNALFARSDLFVFPSLYDTSGLVVREAAAQGTPSVVVMNSSAAECIENLQNGMLCENNPESLAQSIRYALMNPDLLHRMGQNAKESIPIPWDVLAEQTLERYAALIDEKKKIPSRTRRGYLVRTLKGLVRKKS